MQEFKELNIRQDLLALEDLKYKEFFKKHIPNIDEKNIIGIRIPALRKYAEKILKDKAYEPLILDFLSNLPHKYYEENNLHGILISKNKDIDECFENLNKFLPYIDNWSTCDLISPKIFKKNLDDLYENIKLWIKSEHTYTIRFAIKMLMDFYLGDNFKKEYADLVSKVNSNEYYVNMCVAWYFATALAKQYDLVIPYIENKQLPKWTHNKAIQKSIESYRISDNQKAYIKNFKI